VRSWTTTNGTRIFLVCSGRSNVYLVANETASFLVDAGMFAAAPLVTHGVARTGAPAPSYLVLTHTHFDHAGATASLRRRFNLKTIVCDHDVKFLGCGDSPFPEGNTRAIRALMAVIRRPGELMMQYPPAVTDIPVRGRLDMGPLGFDGTEVIHTPGHSMGSVSVVVDKEIAMVGDTLYGLALRSVMPPLVDEPIKLFFSLCALRDTGARLYLPGHGPAIPRERLEKLIDELS